MVDAGPAGGGGGGLSRAVLVLGYGNTLRRDDGAGAVAARLLAADPRLAGDGVEVREAYQLLPEMALDIAAVTLVVFVDAEMRGLPGSVAVHELVGEGAPAGGSDAGADAGVGAGAEAEARAGVSARAEAGARAGPSSHHVGGAELVALADALTGHRPAAVAVGIGVADTGLGEGLSPAVEAAMPRVVEVVVGLVERHLARE